MHTKQSLFFRVFCSAVSLSLSLSASLLPFSSLSFSYYYISQLVYFLIINMNFWTFFTVFPYLIQLVHAKNKKKKEEETKKRKKKAGNPNRQGKESLTFRTNYRFTMTDMPITRRTKWERKRKKISPAPWQKRKWETGQRKNWAKRSYYLFNVLENALNYDEWTTVLTTGGWKFLRKAQTKESTAQARVASTAPLLHPQSKNFPRRTTQRQQRQFKKRKEANFFEYFQFEMERSMVKIDLGWPSNCR